MMVHGESVEPALIDFFVAAPGRDGVERRAELVPVPVHFDAETAQTFYVGPASCGVPGTAAGLELAIEMHGTAPLADLVGPGVRLAREGAPVNAEQAYILDILAPIHARLEGTRELYAPRGRPLREGDVFRFPELAEALERFGAEGAEPFYRGEVAAAISELVLEHGGSLGPGDLAAYEAIPRAPIRVPFRGTEVLTNPPPSSGGILIAYCLGLLERMGETSGPEQLVAAMGAANDARGEDFAAGAARRGPRREPARGRGARSRRRRPARLDHAHLRPRRRGHVRQRHLLQRLRLRRPRPGGGRDPQQHARRGRPQPARLPPDRAGAPGLLDDGADRRPARRRDRARARQRRLQPDPLRDPADRRPGGRAGDGGGRGGAPRRGCTSSAESSRPSPGSTRRRWPASRSAGSRSPAAPRSTYSSAACRPSRATERPGL